MVPSNLPTNKSTSASPSMSTNTAETKATYERHLQAVFKGDIDAILSDYTGESVLYAPDGPIRGIEELREFFIPFMSNKPEGFPESFEKIHEDVEGEIAYLVYKCEPAIPMGMDTFIIRDGRIVLQTFAAYMPS